MKKLLSIICILVLTISLTGCRVETMSSSNQYSVEQLLDFYVESISKNDFNLLYKVFPKFYIEASKQYLNKERQTEQYKNYKEEFGDDFKVTYTINSKEKITKEKLDNLNNNLSKYNAKATDCYEVNVTITFSGSNSTDSDTLPLGYCKVDGAWYILE